MRIALLLHNAYAIGGTTRTSFHLAAALAERHDVRIVSVFRNRAEPALEPPADVSLMPLVDRRESAADHTHPLAKEPGRYFPAGDSRSTQYHRLAEDRVIEWFKETDTDAVISTRSGLNVLLARFGPRRALRIAQEHLTHDSQTHGLRRQLQRWYPHLDALVTLTKADARAHRDGLRLAVPIEAIPNSIPATRVPLSDGKSKIIVAAGRLTKVKRYDMLIDAFAGISDRHPDWSLRIYGAGTEKERLAAQIEQLGLAQQVQLMGAVTPIEPEWAKGSIAAVSSAQESFGMTILEAMRCGLPVVSTDCPHGPREIIRDGVDGRLVPRDDVGAYGAALEQLIEDDSLRTKMAAAAQRRPELDFAPQDIAGRYDELLERLRTLDRAAVDRERGGVSLRRALSRAGRTMAPYRATGSIAARGALRRLRRLRRALRKAAHR